MLSSAKAIARFENGQGKVNNNKKKMINFIWIVNRKNIIFNSGLYFLETLEH